MKGYIYKLELKDNELKDFIKKNLGENLICIPESLDFMNHFLIFQMI